MTRSSSPWICALTDLGPSSRMILEIFLAFSLEMPCSIVADQVVLLARTASGSPVSSHFSEMPRLISLVSKTSRIAFTRSSLFASIRTVSPDHLIEAPTFLKSNRCEISLAVWFSALSTSWWSTLLTMSNDESAMARTLSDGRGTATLGRNDLRYDSGG